MKTYADYGILGIDPHGAEEQRTVCPNCPPYDSNGKRRTDKDLAVNVVKGTWHCHRSKCGWKGGLNGGKDFLLSAVFKPKPVPHNLKILGDNTVAWFKEKRGISRQTLDDNGVKADMKCFDGKIEPEVAIAFAYYYDDEIVNIKYRARDRKTFTQSPGGSRVFYGLRNITERDEELIITEGEIDALSYFEAGLKCVVSVPDGAPNPGDTQVEGKLKFLENCADSISHIKKFYIAVDGDAPGLRLREELARRLGKAKCWIVSYPEDCKDANEVLTRLGAEALFDTIDRATPYPVEGIHVANSRRDAMEEMYLYGMPTGYKTGWAETDRKLKLGAGQFVVVTGIPNHGKSPYMDNMMIRMIENNPELKFGVFSPENGDIKIHLHRLIQIKVGKPLLPGYNGRMSQKEMNNAIDWINDKIYFIMPEKGENTMDAILEAEENLVAKFGVNAIIIDPFSSISHDKKIDNDYVASILNRWMKLGVDRGLLQFLVAHPRKMSRKGVTRLHEVPTLYDISESAHWYNKPDAGLVFYRQFDQKKINTLYSVLYVEKIRHKHMGQTGFIKYHFDVSCERFQEDGEIQQIKQLEEDAQSYIGTSDYDDEEPF